MEDLGDRLDIQLNYISEVHCNLNLYGHIIQTGTDVEYNRKLYCHYILHIMRLQVPLHLCFKDK